MRWNKNKTPRVLAPCPCADPMLAEHLGAAGATNALHQTLTRHWKTVMKMNDWPNWGFNLQPSKLIWYLESCTGAQVFSTKTDLLLNILPQQCLNNTTAHSYLFPKIIDQAWNYWFRSATALGTLWTTSTWNDRIVSQEKHGKTNVANLHKVRHYCHCFWT